MGKPYFWQAAFEEIPEPKARSLVRAAVGSQHFEKFIDGQTSIDFPVGVLNAE